MKIPHKHFLFLPTGAVALSSMSYLAWAQIHAAKPVHSIVQFDASATNLHW